MYMNIRQKMNSSKKAGGADDESRNQKEDILAIFQKEAKDIRVGDMHNGEFDFWVRFPEENEDEYYYCFKDEGGHMIYHRFCRKIMQISDSERQSEKDKNTDADRNYNYNL